MESIEGNKPYKTKVMTVEELLRPRIKIIAPWPMMDDVMKQILERGIYLSDSDLTNLCGETEVYECLEKYPNIFKPLQWWEERKESEMPEYINILDESMIVKVDSIMSWGFRFFYSPSSSGYGKRTFSEQTVPATKEEYLQSLTNR